MDEGSEEREESEGKEDRIWRMTTPTGLPGEQSELLIYKLTL